MGYVSEFMYLPMAILLRRYHILLLRPNPKPYSIRFLSATSDYGAVAADPPQPLQSSNSYLSSINVPSRDQILLNLSHLRRRFTSQPSTDATSNPASRMPFHKLYSRVVSEKSADRFNWLAGGVVDWPPALNSLRQTLAQIKPRGDRVVMLRKAWDARNGELAGKMLDDFTKEFQNVGLLCRHFLYIARCPAIKDISAKYVLGRPVDYRHNTLVLGWDMDKLGKCGLLGKHVLFVMRCPRMKDIAKRIVKQRWACVALRGSETVGGEVKLREYEDVNREILLMRALCGKVIEEGRVYMNEYKGFRKLVMDFAAIIRRRRLPSVEVQGCGTLELGGDLASEGEDVNRDAIFLRALCDEVLEAGRQDPVEYEEFEKAVWDLARMIEVKRRGNEGAERASMPLN